MSDVPCGPPVPHATLLLIHTFLLILTSAATDSPPIIQTDRGAIRGLRYHVTHLDLSGHAYLGIPYARPPVGDLRFRYPEEAEAWEGVKEATRPHRSCHQAPDEFFGTSFSGSNMWNPNTEVSEDCLYLSVWVPSPRSNPPPAPPSDLPSSDTPPRTPGARLAVLVWIFGGGFYSGTPTLDLYDGRILASLNDVIVVAIGYRVGALGFLCLDHVTAPCNMGLFDQLMALDWVQRNIEGFGGDASNVTLWGESAGSASVSLHLLSPLSRDKFHRAILQSGSANMHWATTTLDEAKLRSRELAVNYLNCEDSGSAKDLAGCLRDKNATWLTEQQWVSRGILQFPFLPVVDGVFLMETPTQALRHGRFKRCPILSGSNLNEGSYFLIYELSDSLSLDRAEMDRATFLRSLRTLFFHYPQYRRELNSSFLLDAIAFQYTNWLDVNDTESNILGLDTAIGDCYFVCPLNEFTMSYALSSGSSSSDEGSPRTKLGVFSYYFTERYRSNPWPSWTGVLHGDEILFVFGHVLKEGGNFTEGERRLSVEMMRYWTNFAKTGNPNEGGVVQRVWPRHTPARREYLELNTRFLKPERRGEGRRDKRRGVKEGGAETRGVGRGPRAKHCAFWMDYVPKLISATANIADKEAEWREAFSEWSTHYVVDWKLHSDLYLTSHSGRCPPPT